MEVTGESEEQQEATLHQDQLQRLKAEHVHIEEKIGKLEALRFPSAGEASQIKQLKREKLSLKEKMARIQFQSS